MLVRRCVAGDAAAWEEIVQTYNRRIYNICYRFAGSADDAEDLAQDVFIKMYRTLASYDSSKGAFVTWVTTITATCWSTISARPSRTGLPTRWTRRLPLTKTRSRSVSKFRTNPRLPTSMYAAGRWEKPYTRPWGSFRRSCVRL